jgi:glycosyltransferase involved in cell wall biosynthesis
MSANPARPTVSVVMATYNRSELLPYSIGSVMRQSFQDWELLVIGDACTDDTGQVVAALAAADPRIRFVNCTPRCGEQAGPNNHGVGLARGRYIAFLNHDDLWLADHLERGVATIERLGADLVFPLPLNIDRQGVPRLYRVDVDGLYHPWTFVPASYWLMRREMAADVGAWRFSNEIWGINTSQDFLYRAHKAGKRMVLDRRVSCLVFSSGNRPGSYKLRDGSELAAWFRRICDDDGLVEELLIALSIDVYGDEPRLWRGVGRQLRSALARRWWQFYLDLGGNPQALAGFLSRRGRGAWLDRLYAYRGLPPRDRIRT